MRAVEQDEAKRAAWWQQVHEFDAWQLVFIDECGVNTAMRRTHARATRGQRAVGTAPRNWKHNTTILGALSPHGVQAVMSLEGPTDTLAFEVFVEKILLATLTPGQIVVLDNLSAHKSAVDKLTVANVRQRACERGAVLSISRQEQRHRKARKLDGAQEAHLVAVVCSIPPDGAARWSLKLIRERLLEMEVVEHIGLETIRTTLKKMNLNPG